MYLKSSIKAPPTRIGTTKINIYKCICYTGTLYSGMPNQFKIYHVNEENHY